MRPHPSADSRCVSAPPLGSRAVALAGCGAEPREEKFNYYVLHVACQNKYSCYAVQYSYYTSDTQDFSRRPTMFGTEEEANEHEEVRSMLDPELSTALELLDASGIQALLEDEGVVPPLQSANSANTTATSTASAASAANAANTPANSPADASSTSEQTPLTKLLGGSLLAWRSTLRTLGYDDVTDYSNVDDAELEELHRLLTAEHGCPVGHANKLLRLIRSQRNGGRELFPRFSAAATASAATASAATASAATASAATASRIGRAVCTYMHIYTCTYKN